MAFREPSCTCQETVLNYSCLYKCTKIYYHIIIAPFKLINKQNNKYLQLLTEISLLHINHDDELQISDSYTSILQHYHNGKLVNFQLIF